MHRSGFVNIIGNPNVGKSTLLNRLLGEERALVSDIAGTTRDIITENISLDGIGFRFIDTAGIRESNDVLERMGIERTYKVLSEARIILYITEPKEFGSTGMRAAIDAIGLHDGQRLAIVVNKCDSEKPSAFAVVIDKIAGIGIQHPRRKEFLIDEGGLVTLGARAQHNGRRHQQAKGKKLSFHISVCLSIFTFNPHTSQTVNPPDLV